MASQLTTHLAAHLTYLAIHLAIDRRMIGHRKLAAKRRLKVNLTLLTEMLSSRLTNVWWLH